MPTNCYVLSEEGDAVIVDPGGGFGKISSYLDSNFLKAVAVVLTHGHFDHIADVFKWRKEGVPVYIHELDASSLYTPEMSLAKMVGLTIPPVRDCCVFKGGDKLVFGKIEMKVIHTPGHTKGGCCFDLPGGVLLTGDTIMLETSGRTDFPGGSTEEMVDSIKNKLFLLEGDRLMYPGHGESTTLNHERLFNPINGIL